MSRGVCCQAALVLNIPLQHYKSHIIHLIHLIQNLVQWLVYFSRHLQCSNHLMFTKRFVCCISELLLKTEQMNIRHENHSALQITAFEWDLMWLVKHHTTVTLIAWIPLDSAIELTITTQAIIISGLIMTPRTVRIGSGSIFRRIAAATLPRSLPTFLASCMCINFAVRKFYNTLEVACSGLSMMARRAQYPPM